MPKMTVADQIKEVLKNFPGSTAKQVQELIASDLTLSHVSATLANLYARGKLIKEKAPDPDYAKRTGKSKGKDWKYVFSLNPNPFPKPPVRELRRKKPTEAGWEARLVEKERQIDELVAWRAAAIKRYPDLAVSPTMMRARKIVSDLLRARGDNQGAKDVLAGKMDNGIIMQSTCAALEDVVEDS